MNILYVGYWPARDVLTQAVIIPRLQILAAHEKVNKVVFCSIERVEHPMPMERLTSQKIKHIPFQSKEGSLVLQKRRDFTQMPQMLRKVVVEEKIDLMICNSPLAGAMGYFVWKKSGTPFVVECFEPHARYMVESKVWRNPGMRYGILRFLENRQKIHAWRLLTVTSNYAAKLAEEGVDSQKIKVMPNALDVDKFVFDPIKRDLIRTQLNIPGNKIIGIYVGKFGGIYYDQEAFDFLKFAFHFFETRLQLIILSTDNKDVIQSKLVKTGIDPGRVHIACVEHREVPDYLSAADFAIATIKPAPSRLFCCPVKNGEYWANGLPILLGDGIGDDSEIIKREGGGVICDFTQPDEALAKLDGILKKGRKEIADEISPLATRHRRIGILEDGYDQLLKEYSAKFH